MGNGDRHGADAAGLPLSISAAAPVVSTWSSLVPRLGKRVAQPVADGGHLPGTCSVYYTLPGD